MADILDAELLHPDVEDFAAAESATGPLHEENGSPAEARVRYEVAQAHKLIRHWKETAQRVRVMGAAGRRRSQRKKRSHY